MPTIIQPPYSPGLNPAERMFKEVRRWVEGRTYRCIEDKVGRSTPIFVNWNRNPPTGRRRVVWPENRILGFQ